MRLVFGKDEILNAMVGGILKLFGTLIKVVLTVVIGTLTKISTRNPI